MRSGDEKTQVHPDKWIARIRESVADMIGMSIESAVVMLAPQIPWHVAAKRKKSRESLARHILKRYVSRGVIEIDGNTIIAVKQSSGARYRPSVWEELLGRLQKGEFPKAIDGFHDHTLSRYYRAMGRLGWVRMEKRGRKNVPVEWTGPENPDGHVVAREHGKIRDKTRHD